MWNRNNILDTKEKLELFNSFVTTNNFEIAAVDTETNGVQFWKSVVIGVSISFDDKIGFYVPFLQWIPDTTITKTSKKSGEHYIDGQLECLWTGKRYPESVTSKEYKPPEWLIKALKGWLLDSSISIIMHNAPFDILMIERNLGFDLTPNLHCDTMLLKHVIDENTSMGLKETALLWSRELGIAVDVLANQEQIDMGASVVKNGGVYNKSRKHIWRADLSVLGNYACADAYLTFGIYNAGMTKLSEDFEPKHFEWFFDDEVMPLCKEVMIPMKREGIVIDVPYFKEMQTETLAKLHALEDEVQEKIAIHIKDFSIGSSIDDVVTGRQMVLYLAERENITLPNSKGKLTLAKSEVNKAYVDTGHWLFGYLLGECPLPYTESEILDLKKEIYTKLTDQRYRFNIQSDMHLRWLFLNKLGYKAKDLPQTDSATKENPIASMKAEVLQQFFLKDHEFVKPLLLYKKLQKLYSTYISPAVELSHNGRLYMDLVQSGTIAGRFACMGGLNLQTLPKVEDLSRCKKCNSKNIISVNYIKLLAAMFCNDCGHEESDILCPSAIKYGFIAPKGRKILNADFSSLEPRAFSFCSGDAGLKAVYLQGLDLYSKIYIDTMEEPEYSADPKDPNFLKKLAPKKRELAKPFALSIPYGARAPQIANLMKFKKPVMKNGVLTEYLDVQRGQDLIDKYLNAYPDLRRFMESQINQALTKGYVETIVGRRRRFKFTVPLFKLLTKAGRDLDWFLDLKRKDIDVVALDSVFTYDALKKLSESCGFGLFDPKGVRRTWAFFRAVAKNELNNAVNFVIQGLAAHIANRAMLETSRIFNAEGIPARVILQVHDELTCYADDEYAETAAAILQFCMENNKYAKLLDIPMIAEPTICLNLKDSK